MLRIEEKPALLFPTCREERKNGAKRALFFPLSREEERKS